MNNDEVKKVLKLPKPMPATVNMASRPNSMTRTLQVRTAEGDTIALPISAPSRIIPQNNPHTGRSLLINSTPAKPPSQVSGKFIKVTSSQVKVVRPSPSMPGPNNIVLIKGGVPMTIKKAFNPVNISGFARYQRQPGEIILAKEPRPIQIVQSKPCQMILNKRSEDNQTSLIRSDWRTYKSVEQPRKYRGLREPDAGAADGLGQGDDEKVMEDDEDDDDESVGCGVEHYLFGTEQKRTPNKQKKEMIKNEFNVDSKLVKIGSIPPVKYWKKKRLHDTHSELNDLKFNDSRSASPTTESAKQPETVEEKEVEQNLTAEEKEIVNKLKWEDGLTSLPGLNGLQLRINSLGLLEVSESQSLECSETPEITNKSDEWYTCAHCGTYGMSLDFINTRYCSKHCLEESDNCRTIKNNRKKAKLDRKGKICKQLVKYVAQRRTLEALKCDGARQVLDMEIFRLAMQLELLKFDTVAVIPGKISINMKYLKQLENSAAPDNLFKEPWPLTKNPFKMGWKLEAIDPRHPSLICVATVVDLRGYRLRIRFDGYGANHDFWVNANSTEIFQPGWCERTDHKLTPPRNWEGTFNWTIYLEKLNATGAPRHAFSHSQERTVMPSGFRSGMKLEAVDKKGKRNVCVATIADVIESRVLVHIDGTEDKNDYWAENNSPYIHPAGWCLANGYELQAPCNIPFTRWNVADKNVFLAPARAFKTRSPHEFKVGMKIEAVDKRNPDVIRVATIIGTESYQIRIKFDGWPTQYAYWIDDDSPEIHPVGWCKKTGHTLTPIPSPESVTRVSECPTPGCSGNGHAFRVSGEHTTAFACPYSPCNYLNDDLVAERFASTAEYLTVKEISQSKGTKPRQLLSTKRSKLIDAKKPSEKVKRKIEEPAPPPPAKKVFTEPISDEESLRLRKLKKEILEKTVGFPENPRTWSTEKVAQLMNLLLGTNKGEAFVEHQIDGEALLMLSNADLSEYLGFKMGPSVTIYNCIKVLRSKALECGNSKIPF